MFWDSSAIVPLLLPEKHSGLLVSLAKGKGFSIWWATPLECQSAVYRHRRHRAINEPTLSRALQRLRMIVEDADIIAPTDTLRDRAGRLLAIHELRTADALQLAAALVWAEQQPHGATFLSLDQRLRRAAAAEGYTVLPE